MSSVKKISIVLSLALAACSVDDQRAVKPGDHFFRTVVTAGSDSATNGTANIILLDPALASKRQPNSPGTTPGLFEATGAFFPRGSGTDPTARVKGEFDPTTGSIKLSGDGWTFEGEVNGTSVHGTVTTPTGQSGNFAGEDAMAARVGTFCGSYSGSGSGSWNLVVSESGHVAGAFDGAAQGTMEGSATSDRLSLQWTGSSGGKEAGGSAVGTIDASGTIVGSWTGTARAKPARGQWQSDATCGGLEPVISANTSPSCGCDTVAINSCCPGFGPCCFQ